MTGVGNPLVKYGAHFVVAHRDHGAVVLNIIRLTGFEFEPHVMVVRRG